MRIRLHEMSDSEEETIEKQLKLIFVGEPSVGKVSMPSKLNYCILI